MTDVSLISVRLQDLRGIYEQLETLNKIMLKLVEIQTTKRQFEDWKDAEGLSKT